MGYKNIFKKVKKFFDYRKPSSANTMDILVVKSRSGELRASSFHIDFGWKVMSPSEKNVQIFVNGTLIDAEMKLSKKGKAYFKVPTDKVGAEHYKSEFSQGEEEIEPQMRERRKSKSDRTILVGK